MVLVVKRHITCPNGTDLCETYIPSFSIRALGHFPEEEEKKRRKMEKLLI